MNDLVTLTGLVATAPKHIVTSEGLPIASFRLASIKREFNRETREWEDVGTNWYTVTAFRQTADNVIRSILKGQRVIVTGRLNIRDWDAGERSGTTVEVEAEAIGHNLAFGTSAFTRTPTTWKES